jgi:potassium-transporting ATPase potassium-binding subunit
MTANSIFQFVFFFGVVLLIMKPLGSYMARVYEGKRLWLDRVLGPVERATYRLSGIKADEEMDWKVYAGTLLAFSLIGMLVLYGLQRLQGWLPFNPQGFGAVAPDLAFNTAASFTTNTNWQAYAGETTMSHLSQMVALTFHNFLSAATGIALAIAVIRGLARAS